MTNGRDEATKRNRGAEERLSELHHRDGFALD